MTDTIKHRIEKIRRGDVPEGYRKAFWGIVPKSWQESRIDRICALSSGSTPRRDTAENFYGNILWVTSGELKRKTIWNTREKISETAVANSHLQMYNPGTVVIAIYGLEAEGIRGTVSIIGKRCTISQACIAFTEFKGIENEFFYYWYLNNGQVIGLRYAQGTKQQNLSSDIVGAFPIYFPRQEEQKKIVTFLFTQDRLIELKEKRLVEKYRQKKYLMQQLLTGKRRLPGFEDTWKYIPAREIFKSITDKKHSGDLQVLSSTQDRGIVPRDQVGIDIKYEADSLSSYKKVEKGNFVISLRSFQGGIEYSDYTGIVSPAYTVLKSIEKISDEYYKQFFKSTDYINRLNIAVYGIRDGKQISYEDFGRIKIPYPSLNEQTAIAKVLSTADREIDLLRQDIEQEKQKKKALMQLLLTGIVRVTR